MKKTGRYCYLEAGEEYEADSVRDVGDEEDRGDQQEGDETLSLDPLYSSNIPDNNIPVTRLAYLIQPISCNTIAWRGCPLLRSEFSHITSTPSLLSLLI